MSSGLKAGVGRAIITPPVGFKLAGYGSRVDDSVGVHDDLYAKALALDDGNKKIIIVSCDLIGVHKELVDNVRENCKDFGISRESIMVAATHTHAGPDILKSDGNYLADLQKSILSAICMALNSLNEAKIGFGRGEAVIGHNRRNPEKEYFLRPWPEGVKDTEVLVLRVDDAHSNQAMAVLVNYACHPVVLGSTNLLISRDYPGYALNVIESVKYEDVLSLFLNGCCGNINPVNTEGGHTVIKGEIVTGDALFREAERLGNILGAEALKVLDQTETDSDITVDAARKEVSLPLREDIPERILKFLKEGKSPYRRAIERGGELLTEVHVLRIGDNAIVGLPGEVFTEYGLEIKEKSPFRYTLVSELANDSFGYIPTPEAYEEGGYEPTASIVAPGSGEIIRDAALDILHRFSAKGLA